MEPTTNWIIRCELRGAIIASMISHYRSGFAELVVLPIRPYRTDKEDSSQ